MKQKPWGLVIYHDCQKSSSTPFKGAFFFFQFLLLLRLELIPTVLFSLLASFYMMGLFSKSKTDCMGILTDNPKVHFVVSLHKLTSSSFVPIWLQF